MALGVWTFAAYCRNSLDGQWYSYDDSTVESLPEDEVNSRGAYILFYQKRNSIPLWSASSSLRGRYLLLRKERGARKVLGRMMTRTGRTHGIWHGELLLQHRDLGMTGQCPIHKEQYQVAGASWRFGGFSFPVSLEPDFNFFFLKRFIFLFFEPETEHKWERQEGVPSRPLH